MLFLQGSFRERTISIISAAGQVNNLYLIWTSRQYQPSAKTFILCIVGAWRSSKNAYEGHGVGAGQRDSTREN
jgi:hypothetical protein